MIRAKPLEWKGGSAPFANSYFSRSVNVYTDDFVLLYMGSFIGEYGSVDALLAAAQAHADNLVRDMAQPVTPEDAARVLLEDEFKLIYSEFGMAAWKEWAKQPYDAGVAMALTYAAIAGLRAIVTPPQEKALQELADLGQEFDAAPQEKAE